MYKISILWVGKSILDFLHYTFKMIDFMLQAHYISALFDSTVLHKLKKFSRLLKIPDALPADSYSGYYEKARALIFVCVRLRYCLT